MKIITILKRQNQPTIGAPVYKDLCKQDIKIGSCALVDLIILLVACYLEKRECCPYLRERE